MNRRDFLKSLAATSAMVAVPLVVQRMERGDYINVLDYWTIGDPDDSDMIRRAINAAEGRTVYFPSGTYRTSYQVDRDVRLLGSAPRATVIDSSTISMA